MFSLELMPLPLPLLVSIRAVFDRCSAAAATSTSASASASAAAPEMATTIEQQFHFGRILSSCALKKIIHYLAGGTFVFPLFVGLQ